jgi:hypothetical protein
MPRPNPDDQNQIDVLGTSAKMERPAVDPWYGHHSDAADADPVDSGVVLVEEVLLLDCRLPPVVPPPLPPLSLQERQTASEL